KILEKAGSLSFLARKNHELVAGTQAVGAFKGTDAGTTDSSATVAASFTEIAGVPHINCLAESSTGKVFACTQNYGSPTIPKDDFGIMSSMDLVTWTGVLKFQDIVEPTTCATGSVQKDRCDTVLWCGLCAQLGCEANRDCTVAGDAGQVD